MFYWMRLFKEFAHFISLISATLSNVKVFLMLNLLVIIAFANFLVIINSNTPSTLNNHYVSNYFGNSYLDAMMQVYLLEIGKFDLLPRKMDKTNYVIMTITALGTFLLMIVFMNMLIAIMTDTYYELNLITEESRI